MVNGRTGEGWIYYDAATGYLPKESDIRICVTSETDFSKIEPTDSSFVYKGSLSDPGSPALAPNSSDSDDDNRKRNSGA